jgi:prepilin-type N-terminal cleavage/methylation domain-containing protein
LIPYQRNHHPGGFTLIEVLLVLALIGVLAGLAAGNIGAFIAGARQEPPGRVLKKAVLDAIYETSESKKTTYLHYHEENASFKVSDTSGNEISSHSIYKGEWRDDYELPEVLFEAIGPKAGVDGGPTRYDQDELELSKIPFHYGSSVPFMTKIRFRGESIKIYFDPFSGYALKHESED